MVTGPPDGVAAEVRSLVAGVPDPELPMLTVEDLGVLREVTVGADGQVTVTVTPTYSGCPAMDAIRADVAAVLHEHGYSDVTVRTVLAPAWSTDWISPAGRAKLAAAGIAPPGPRTGPGPVPLTLAPRCPRCGTAEVREVSRFGATACQALYACRACGEPFAHVKAL